MNFATIIRELASPELSTEQIVTHDTEDQPKYTTNQ